MKWLVICGLSLVVLALSTPLDDYVNTPDPTYTYSLNSTIDGVGYKAYVLNMISQTWLTPKDSDSSIWRHWLVVCIPNYVNPILGKTSFLYIDGT